MKKIISVLTALLLIAILSACAVNGDNDDTTTAGTTETTSTDATTLGTDSTTGTTGQTETTETPNSDFSIEDATLEEILAKIYSSDIYSEDFKEFLSTSEDDWGLMTREITTENCKYYLGLDNVDFARGIASEPQMQPSLYSVCLVKANNINDVEDLKAEIEENVDPQKWICMGINPDYIIVDSIGDVIILIMSSEYEALHSAFLALA